MSPKVKFADGKSRGGHSHAWAQYFNRAATGVTEDFGCGHKVTERFLVWSQGHESFLVWSQGH